MQFLLDTDICIHIARRKPSGVQARFQQMQTGDVGMSIVTYLELAFGAWKSMRVKENLARIEQLRSMIPVLPLDVGAAEHYGRIRARLEKQGSRIGAFDTVIAAHALSLGLTLVTNNVGEFSRVEGLKLENWAA